MAIRMKRGTVASFEDLITIVSTWVTDRAVHGADAWQLMRSEAWPRGTIFKTRGRKEGEVLYLGLMANRIEKGKTYAEWFMQEKNLATYFVWHKNGLNKIAPVEVSGSTVNKATFTGTPDIFTHSARVLHFGVFKQYAEALDWHEQPGGMKFDKFELLPIQYTVEGSPRAIDFHPPLFPGCGYPALGMNFEGPKNLVFDYWLVKDAHTLSVVVNNSGVWDHAFLGAFLPYDNEEYAFPAVVIGGTSGFVEKGINVWYSPAQQTPTPVVGMQLDYRPEDWSVAHGLALFAGAAEDRDGTPTHVMVCLPDGRWRGAANYVQGLDVVPHFVCSGPVPLYHFVRKPPERPQHILYRIRPTESDVQDFSHLYDEGETWKLEPIEILAAGKEQSGILGRIPYISFPSHPVGKEGEARINGKRHLALPNGWAGRKFHIKGRAGIVYEEDVEKLLEEERKDYAQAKSRHMLLRLEE